MRAILKMGFEIAKNGLKFGLWIIMEIWKMGIEIYRNPENVAKIIKNEWKLMISLLTPKIEQKGRKFIKNGSRRSRNLKYKNDQNKMGYLITTVILYSDEENIENVRSGRKGKTILLRAI